MDLFKILGTIAINNDDANKSIDETSGKASNFGEKLKSGISTAAKWGTAIVGGATVAAGAMVKFAESSAATADNIDKMSQKIGISRQAYQELDFICSQSGTSVDNLQMGLKTLTGQMDKVTEGNKAATENFERLGISVTDANGQLRSQEDVMWETLTALQGVENQTEKARLATELFGKSGSELMPLLNGTSGSLEEMKQQAHDLGLVLSDELIDNGVNLTDSIDQTKRAFASIVTQLGGSLMPIVEQISDYIQQSLPNIQAVISRLAPILTSLFEGIMPPLMELAEELFPIIFDLIEQLIPPITEIIQAVLPVVVTLLKTLLPPLIQIIQAVLPALMPILKAILALIEPFMPLLEPILDLLVMLLNAIIPPLTKVLEFLAKAISGYLTNAVKQILPIIKNVKGYFEGLIDFVTGVFTGNWEKAWSGVTKIFKNLFEGLVNMAKAPLNTIIGAINNVFAKIGTIEIPDWVPGIGGSSFSLPQLPMLAHGGVLEKGQVGLLEGDGAEAVVPLEKNTEWIRKVSQELNVNAFGNEKFDRLEEAVQSMLDCMTQYLPQMANMQLVMDTGATVGALAPGMDKELGRRAAKKGRNV